MAMIPLARIPSVKIGPRRCCIFGVSRKGTDSIVAKRGV